MPTYAELEQESWWRAEFEAPAHAAFNTRLRAFYGHTRAQTGSKGDNRHLKGRHRSRNWDLNSIYCTNRAYATTDARDKAGNGDWLRATDVGIKDATLRGASARLKTAVEAGLLPCVAEWFGTIDGSTVTGWYQGRPSSSDDSHLWHLHVGLWTSYCDDAAQLRLLGDIITGEDDMALSDKDALWLIHRVKALVEDEAIFLTGPQKGSPVPFVVRSKADSAKLDAVLAELAGLRIVIDAVAVAIEAGGGSVDLAAIDARLALLREQVEADTRDALADLAEGGAAAARADA